MTGCGNGSYIYDTLYIFPVPCILVFELLKILQIWLIGKEFQNESTFHLPFKAFPVTADYYSTRIGFLRREFFLFEVYYLVSLIPQKAVQVRVGIVVSWGIFSFFFYLLIITNQIILITKRQGTDLSWMDKFTLSSCLSFNWFVVLNGVVTLRK